MTRCFLLTAGLLAAMCAAQAAPPTQGERDRAMSELHATRKAFVDAITGLSEAQWNFKPGPGRWSIAECAEHIALSEDRLFELITKKVMESPAAAPAGDAQQRDQRILAGIVDRSKKAQAPEALQPSKRWASREELIRHFKESRDRTIAFIRTTQLDLRAHSAPHPAFGPVDGYEWLLIIAGHTQRHIDQMQEVRASPLFPRR